MDSRSFINYVPIDIHIELRTIDTVDIHVMIVKDMLLYVSIKKV